MPKIEKRVVIGFETSKEFKEKAVSLAKKYKVDGISCPLTLSAFCRIATEMLIKKTEEEVK